MLSRDELEVALGRCAGELARERGHGGLGEQGNGGRTLLREAGQRNEGRDERGERETKTHEEGAREVGRASAEAESALLR